MRRVYVDENKIYCLEQIKPRKLTNKKLNIYSPLPKISPTKIDCEWGNNFCSLRKFSINGLVFQKKLCLPLY